ncbi:MAG: NAD(P)-binding domain-containing protein [Myxococcota bacterium]
MRYDERVEEIAVVDGAFEVRSTRERYRSSTVLLAIGRRGTPRHLGVPGEDHSKVVYRLVGAEQYRGRRVLVVGGGDSALEAACSLAEEPNTTAILSYRGNAFSRAKQENRARVDAAVASGKLTIYLDSNVLAIHPSTVEIQTERGVQTIENDAVIVCVGGVLPTGFLRSIGVKIETKHGTA